MLRWQGVIRKHAEQYRASGAEAIVPTPGMPMSYDMGAKRMREAADYSFGRLSKPTGVADVMEVCYVWMRQSFCFCFFESAQW